MKEKLHTFPFISVVLPVFNREQYIGETIESIITQTYNNFELIIVNDGSTDRTRKIIESYGDLRIKLINHERRKGVAAARNTGYSASRGKYIAISDSDDINLPNRLEKQVAFLEKYLEIDVVTCWIKEFDEKGIKDEIKFDTVNEEIRSNLIFNPGVPAFMMFRKERMIEYNCLYHDETYLAAVDYQWYASLPRNVKISCIPETLYLYRRHHNQISTGGFNKQQKYANLIRKNELGKIGIRPTDEELMLHFYLSYVSMAPVNQINFEKIFNWCRKIISFNKRFNYYNQLEFDKNVTKKLYGLVERFDIYNENLFNEFLKQPFLINVLPESKLDIDLLVKQIVNNNKCNIIFGTKRLGFYLLKELEKQNIHVKYFLDNNINNKNKRMSGILIKNPVEIKHELTSCNIIISILSDTRFEIKKTLINTFNLDEKNIFLFDDFCKSTL